MTKVAIIYDAQDLRIEDQTIAEVGPQDLRVRIRIGGICGSDLHYFQHGGFGSVRLREPMILGHEVAGEVEAVGCDVTRIKPGDAVAINPSLPCGRCRFCQCDMRNQCLDMRFYGSAMRMPHVQGAFRERLVCHQSQAILLPPSLSFSSAAFAEPLSVCLHAARQAGNLLGARVLVSGAGPIGALAVLAARHGGAREVVATDLLDAPLALVRKIGADHSVNLQREPDGLAGYAADKGYFDVVFEASGSASAILSALQVVRPRGTIVQIGLGGEVAMPLTLLTGKEIAWRGSFRFHEEFAVAVDCIASGAIDVAPLLTEILPLADAAKAFALAGDRSRSMKVQIAL